MFDFTVEIETVDGFRHHVSHLLRTAKDRIEEEAPIAYVNIAEQIDVWGNKFVIVAKNIPLNLYPDAKEWISAIRRALP